MTHPMATNNSITGYIASKRLSGGRNSDMNPMDARDPHTMPPETTIDFKTDVMRSFGEMLSITILATAAMTKGSMQYPRTHRD
jgi:hypothetical protein